VSKTGYYTHRDCRKHEMGPGHPECPARLDAIEDRLLVSGVADALEHREAPLASLADIELAHDRMHMAALRGLSDMLIEEEDAGGSPLIQLDTDTAMNRYTWTAALRAAGAALEATDAVVAGELENAFCGVRPPGHHATRSRAMGFCFFNNVAVGAAHALERHGLERVAVVDFDVHHGNGTQDIFWSDKDLFYGSTHQMPLFPGTGDLSETGVGNIWNAPLRAGDAGEAFREAFTSRILGPLHNFGPDLIVISAGFDAHKHDPLGGLRLVEADFMWATEAIGKAAERHCQGRIVSMLEGGYDLDALAKSVAVHVRTLMDLGS